MSMDLTLFDPSTGEVMEPWQLNDINRTAYEAYKGAIELLEKQPDTTTHDSIPAKTGGNDGGGTSGDCISRQQAIDAFYQYPNINWTILDVMEKINELPSIQPEHKTGRWIYGESEVGNDGYYCSECGNFVPWIYEESAMNFIREYKFCPNCGAKMEGDEAE